MDPELNLVERLLHSSGLFIGCSFVTLFELSELVLEIGFILYNNKNRINDIELEGDKEEKEEAIINIKKLNEKMSEINSKIELILKSIDQSSKK